jgi:hypothetical protein
MTRPATGPATTVPSTQPAPDERPILVDREGNYYYDGTTTLRVVKHDGELVEWPLPPAAIGGDGPVFLVRSQDGTLFLFNQPGRVLRIRWSDDEEAGEPFALDATFTRNIPDVKNPTRIWLDPFDRIVMAHASQLTILFPKGYVPPVMSNLMTARDESALMDEE